MDKRYVRLTEFYILTVILLLVGLSYLTSYLYETFEGKPISLQQSFIFVIETMTTTGYGELLPFNSWVMSIYSFFLMLLGIGLIFVVFATVAIEWFRSRFEEIPPAVAKRGMRNHVIIASYDPLVESLISRLSRDGITSLVIDPSPEVVRSLLRRGIPSIKGDSSNRETLINANIHKARALITSKSDEENANVVLEARALNDVPIISTVEDVNHMKNLKYAGANEVISPKRVLGEELGRWALASVPHPILEATKALGGMELVELPVYPYAEAAGKTLREMDLRARTGAMVLGIWHNGTFQLIESSDVEIPAASVMLALGTREQMDRLAVIVSSPKKAMGRVFGNYVVAGRGEVGGRVIELLESENKEYVVVDEVGDEEDETGALVIGDATSEITLMQAGIETASTFVIALDEDSESIFATLVARELNPQLRSLARANRSDSVDRLYRAGADCVLSLPEVGAEMVSRLLQGKRAKQIDDYDIRLLEFPVTGALEGRTIAESEVYTKTGCLIVAVNENGRIQANPPASTRLKRGTLLIVLGNERNIQEFERRFA